MHAPTRRPLDVGFVRSDDVKTKTVHTVIETFADGTKLVRETELGSDGAMCDQCRKQRMAHGQPQQLFVYFTETSPGDNEQHRGSFCSNKCHARHREHDQYLCTVPWADDRFTVVSYLRTVTPDGKNWLPRDIVGKDGKTLIVYRHASDGVYAIDGWEPWHDGAYGGRYQSVQAAFAWVERAIAVRAGIATDFRGV